MEGKRWTIWVCDCGYYSTQRGKCRSHPFPCRAMGPDLGDPIEVMPITEHQDQVRELEAERDARYTLAAVRDRLLGIEVTRPLVERLFGDDWSGDHIAQVEAALDKAFTEEGR